MLRHYARIGATARLVWWTHSMVPAPLDQVADAQR
jgi:hypothetical protein